MMLVACQFQNVIQFTHFYFIFLEIIIKNDFISSNNLNICNNLNTFIV